MLRILGIGIALLFILERTAVAVYLSQPWSRELTGEEVLFIIGSTLFCLLPLLIALGVLVFVRPGGVVWWAAGVYALLAGVLNVVVDVGVLMSEDAQGVLALPFLTFYQLALLVPVVIVTAVVVAVRAHRDRKPMTTGSRPAETQGAPTGK